MMTPQVLQKGIYLEKKPDTPKVDFNAKDGKLEISGRSLPENAEMFYQPLIGWLESYITNAPIQTVLTIELEYFNSSSVKQILAILIKLEELSLKGNEVVVIWSYNEDDELMEMKGRELESIVELPFNLVSFSV